MSMYYCLGGSILPAVVMIEGLGAALADVGAANEET